MIFSDTFFFIIAFNLFLIAVLKAFYWKFTKQLFFSVFAQRYANQYLKEENVFTERVTLVFTLIMLINISLLLTRIIYGVTLSLLDFWNVLIVVGVFFIVKMIVIRLLGNIFILDVLAKLGVYFSFLFDRVMGIVLFPIVVFMFFSPLNTEPILLWISAGVIFVFLLIKVFWICKIGIGGFGLSKIYLFLYLCMLEILPLLLFVKAVFY